jgi:large subunit ribosomal protein L13
MKNNNTNNDWILINAENKILGRLASNIANYLMGKNTINYAKNKISGYKVIVVNAKKIILTGKKSNNKIYYRHSGYPGGIKKSYYKDLILKNPSYIIKNAIKGMLPKNKLQKKMLKRLRIFSEAEHKHIAQKPKILNI